MVLMTIGATVLGKNALDTNAKNMEIKRKISDDLSLKSRTKADCEVEVQFTDPKNIEEYKQALKNFKRAEADLEISKMKFQQMDSMTEEPLLASMFKLNALFRGNK